MLAEIPPPFGDFLKSATGQLLKLPTCACRNSAPHLEIFQNLSLDSYLSYLHVLAEIPPPFGDFQKSATGQLPKLPTCACRNSAPHLEIFQNLPLDSYLSCLHVLAEIPPQFADFPKSATGQLPKLPTCACRNSPPSLQIFQNLPLDSYRSYLHVLAGIPPHLEIFQNLSLDSYLSYLHVLAEIPPPFGDFLKSATGQLPKLPTCACRNSAPHLEIFQNLSLDSYLSYLHVLAEIPPHLEIFRNLPLDSYRSYLHVLAEILPPIWRFSKICHWTVT